MLNVFTPYSTALPYTGQAPQGYRADDAERIASYQLYEQMYWNAPETFSVKQRGSETNPVYIPSSKIIVESCNRFLGLDFDYLVDPLFGSEEDRGLVDFLMRNLWVREQFQAKYNAQKRFGLIRGDAIWHVTADPLKEKGTRISINEVDPAAYFPIYDEDDDSRIVGVHLIETIIDPNTTSTEVIQRQTYRKDPDRPGVITSELGIYEFGKWDDRPLGGTNVPEIKLLRVVEPLFDLPPEITALPVYHIRNTRNPADPFGSSELRGLERVAAAVNQGIADEELALALTGLGLYVTDAGPPTDPETGEELDWILGPGRVVEVEGGKTFNRVDGVRTITPSQEHIAFLMRMMKESAGVSEIASGSFDVDVAESGIALRLRLQPILSTNKEKEVEMASVYDHMLFDLVRGWFPAYEECRTESVIVGSVFGDPIPVNKDKEIERILLMVEKGVADSDWARVQLSLLGYEFDAGMADRVNKERRAVAEALLSDPYTDRLRGNLTEDDKPEGGA